MKALILAGGESSRMKTDKALLKQAGVTLVERLWIEIKKAGFDDIYVSTTAKSQVNELGLRILHDDVIQMGPAAGLLRAFRENPETLWFVIACDFPLAKATDIAFLVERHRKNENVDITCYAHSDGTPEPLFAIWTPNALRRVKMNAAVGMTGPSKTISEMEVQFLRPRHSGVLVNTNTPAEWTNVSS